MATNKNEINLILFGTQTGTAEDLAEQLGDTLSENGISRRVENMFDMTLSQVKEYQRIIIIVSTWGDGDPPDDAEALYQELKESSAGALNGKQFSVFGLGDTGYEQFCKCGIDFDQYLETAGATRLLSRVDADIDFDDQFEAWQEAISSAIQ